MYALKFNFLVFFICFNLVSVFSFSQSFEYLLIEKPGTSKRFIFKKGDLLKIKLAEESIYLTGEIDLLLDSSLVLEGHIIPLNEIKQIKLLRKGELMPKINALSYKLPLAAVLLILFEGISSELQGYNPLVEEDTIFVAGGLTGVGVALSTLKNKHLKIGKKYRVRIVRIDLLK